MKLVKYFYLISLLLSLSSCQTCKEDNNKANKAPNLAPHRSTQPNMQNQQSNTSYSGKNILLQESYSIAADLESANKLAHQYHKLKTQIAAKPGKNLDPSFVGIEQIKKDLRTRLASNDGDLEKFINWVETSDWKQFGPNYHHYDWWMFPIDRGSSQGLRYTVFQEDIEQLKMDLSWLNNYRLGAILLIQSWGWDVKNKKNYIDLAPGQVWCNWGVRLGKLANSLILFEQWDLYDSLKSYVDHLIQSGVKLEDWVLKYFTSK
jgi:hypothetical protein